MTPELPGPLLVGFIVQGIIAAMMGLLVWSLRFNVQMAVKKMESVDSQLGSINATMATINQTVAVNTADLRHHFENDAMQFKHNLDTCYERHESVTAQLASSKESAKHRHEEIMAILQRDERDRDAMRQLLERRR